MRENGARYKGKRLAQAEKERSFWRDCGSLLVTALVVVVLFRFVLQLAWVPSGSMKATIPERSLLISLRLPYLVGDPEPERGDVVTFWDQEMDKLLVKRVIGLPGEKITFQNGYVYIDGQRIEEPYLPAQGITVSGNQEMYQVPEGCIFVMGDNRENSLDSRRFSSPYIPVEEVRARTMVVISALPAKEGDEEMHWRGVRTMHG